MAIQNIQRGHGSRGPMNEQEMAKYVIDTAYLHCFTCELEWNYPLPTYFANPPDRCPRCRAINYEASWINHGYNDPGEVRFPLLNAIIERDVIRSSHN